MPPSYCAGGVDQEFGDSGDVAVILASIRNQQIIPADHLGFAIAKQGKCEVGLAEQLPGFVAGVCADGNCPDACSFKKS
jgi:hypothetical protein